MSWRDDAACAGIDTELFFPFEGSAAQVAQAKRVCRRCPVAATCLEFALENREFYGVWGGLTEKERGRIVRRHGRRHPPHVDDTIRRMRAEGATDRQIAKLLAWPSPGSVTAYRKRHLPETIGVP